MFAERLKLTLKDRNLTQLQLAQELGVTQQAVNRWCQKLTQPDYVTIVKIAKILKVPTDYLLGNDEEFTMEEEELKEKEILKKALQSAGFMDNKEDLTDEELEKLMRFVVANKEFLKDEK